MQRLFRKRRPKNHIRPQRRRLAAEPLEARRVLAASLGWDGPGLGSADLTYTVSNSPASLSQAEVDAAIATAFDAWSSVVDVDFTKVNQTGLRDSIDISFASIDGSGRTLAQAYFPDDVNPARIAGDIQFDTAESWEIGNSLGNRAFDLTWVAAHEIGHALGLDHLDEAGSVLRGFVSPNQTFTGLSTSDVREIQEIYATADDSVALDAPIDQSPVDPPVTTPTTDPTNTPDPTNTDDTDTGDTDDDPFPRRRWHRWGHWRRWGGRLDADIPYNQNPYNPMDTNDDGSTSAIDALVIINQLNANNAEGTGLCDVNGDGETSALDALMVINALNQIDAEPVDEAAESSSGTEMVDFDDTMLPVDDTNTIDDTNTVDDNNEVDDAEEPVDMEDPSIVDDTTDPIDDVVDPVDDTVDPVDAEVDPTDEETDPNDDVVDPVDDVVDPVDDETDPVDDSEQPTEEDEPTDDEPTDDEPIDDEPVDDEPVDDEPVDDEPVDVDETDDVPTDPVDDGGQIDEGDMDDEHCEHEHDRERHGHHRHGHHRSGGRGLLHGDATKLFTRFDADMDGVLIETEVPESIWQRLIDQSVDGDADGSITTEEVETYIAAQRAEKFANKDENSDGLLTEDEVSSRFWSKLSVADTDLDGGVSLGELETWLEERGSEPSDMTPETTPMPAMEIMERVFAQLGQRAGHRFSHGHR